MSEELKKVKIRVLPDMNICRAEDMHIRDFGDCQVEKPYECAWSLSFGEGFFSRHPNRAEIIRNTNNALSQDSDRMKRDDVL